MEDKDFKALDALLKEKLSEPSIPFDERDWTAMEQLLDGKGKKRPLVAWWYVMGGIAASLIIAFFIWNGLSSMDTKVSKKNNMSTKALPKPHNRDTVSSPVDKKEASENASQLAVKPPFEQTTNFAQNRPKVRVAMQNGITGKDSILSTGTTLPVNTGEANVYAKNGIINTYLTVGSDSTKELSLDKRIAPVLTFADNTVKQPKTKPDLQLVKPKGVAWSLSMLASPDLNSVNQQSNYKTGLNVGLMVNAAISKKLSISTGLIYSKKLYNSNGANYLPATSNAYNNTYTPSYTPSSVDANCNVIDIPLNLNYKFATVGKNSFSFTTGLSSYIMLTEKYNMQYNLAAGQWSNDLFIRGQNQHIFGILNLGIGYERQINNNFGIGLQPYYKLPLGGIGYGNVKLKSVGAFLNINYKLKHTKNK